MKTGRIEPRSVKAVILVAGVGSRLRPYTDDRPKCLVEAGGQPLLARMLRQLAEAGLSEAILVTGHMDDVIDAYLAKHTPPLVVSTVFNADYATLGNAHSLLVARDAVASSPFIKLDGDLVMSDGLVGRLLVGGCESAIMMDSTATLAEEEMKATLGQDGNVTALGKWLDPETAAGESIGMELIGSGDSARLFTMLRKVVHEEGKGGVYYEDVYHRMITEGWVLGAVSTGGLAWTEVDTADDLRRAASVVGNGQL